MTTSPRSFTREQLVVELTRISREYLRRGASSVQPDTRIIYALVSHEILTACDTRKHLEADLERLAKEYLRRGRESVQTESRVLYALVADDLFTAIDGKRTVTR